MNLGGLTGVGVACLVSQILVALLLLLTGRSGLWPDRPGWRGLLSELEQVPLGLRRAGAAARSGAAWPRRSRPAAWRRPSSTGC